MSNREYRERVFQNLFDNRSPSAGLGPAQGLDLLLDRIVRTSAFKDSYREWLRVEALAKPTPDYGTFLKDEELAELYPEAAEVFDVDDIRRAVIMIRMILDYGESSFSREEGDAVYCLLRGILDQEDYLFDGTWSANNPAENFRAARSASFSDLDLIAEDDVPSSVDSSDSNSPMGGTPS